MSQQFATGSLLGFMGTPHTAGGMAHFADTDRDTDTEWDAGHVNSDVNSAQAMGAINRIEGYVNGYVRTNFLDFSIDQLALRFPSSVETTNALTFPNQPVVNQGQLICFIPRSVLLPTHTLADIKDLDDVLWLMNGVAEPTSIQLQQLRQAGGSTPGHDVTFRALAGREFAVSTNNPKYVLPQGARNVFRGRLSDLIPAVQTNTWDDGCFGDLSLIL